jgi:TolB protein
MNADGSGAKRLTYTVVYDGGLFFSPDGQWISYRAHHTRTGEEIAKYKSLLAQGLVEPSEMDLWVMRADGSEQRQITKLAGASFAPSFYSESRRIILQQNLSGRYVGSLF